MFQCSKYRSIAIYSAVYFDSQLPSYIDNLSIYMLTNDAITISLHENGFSMQEILMSLDFNINTTC